MDQQDIQQQLDRIEAALNSLMEQQTVQEFYTTDELAKLLHRDPWTVREWCRLGRVNSQKKQSGRGKFQAWVISHEELLRIKREGLLPLTRPA